MLTLLAPAERLLGTGRTLLVFAAGHLGATAVTVAGVGVGVSFGWLPRSLEYASDVGPSYGLAAVAGVLATRLRPGLVRLAAIGAFVAALGLAVLVESDFTNAGHLVAVLLGLALAPLATRALRRGSPRHASPGPHHLAPTVVHI
jgi:hypothetical protein